MLRDNKDKPAEINQYALDDEIDLFELVDGLIAEKVTVISIFLIVTLLAGLFAFLSPKTYEVNASFLPPLEKDIITLNYPDVLDVGLDRVYRQFVEVITSPDLGIYLFKDPAIEQTFKEPDRSPSSIVTTLMKNINVSLPTESKAKVLTGQSLSVALSAQWSTPEEAYLLVSTIIETVDKRAKSELLDDLLKTLDEKLILNRKQFELENQQVNQELAAEISRLLEADQEEKKIIQAEIKLLRQKAAQQRSFQISRLETDLALAQQLGITRPVDPLDYRREMGTTTTIDLTSRVPSRYWLGTEILEAEIQELKSRTSDDPYIDGLSDLQKKLTALENNHRIDTLKARTDNVPFSDSLRELKKMENELLQAQQRLQTADFEVFRLAQTPTLPTHPTKPNKMMILALGAVAGGMLGIIAGLIRRAMINRRKAVADKES
jgi:chain length determinant protein (polysaccharide antigen chain regulator)